MMEPRNRVVQLTRFGDPEGLTVVDAPLPTAGRGEVRVRVLASGLEYTDVPIRRHHASDRQSTPEASRHPSSGEA